MVNNWKRLTHGSDSQIFVNTKEALIKKQFTGDNMEQKCKHEWDIYNKLKSANVPHVITYHQVCFKKHYIIMDYKPFDLEKVIVQKQLCSKQNKQNVIKQIHAFLKVCHDAGVSHNDFKAKNILVDTELNIFVSDFDLSNSGNKVNTYDDFQKLIVLLLQIKKNMRYADVVKLLVKAGLFKEENDGDDGEDDEDECMEEEED